MPDVHLSSADTFTIHMEQDPLLRSTIVALVILDRAPQWERLSAAMDRATRLEPNFRRRLSPGSGPFLPARWTDDPDFDLTWHLRRIAVADPDGPGDDRMGQVLEFARVAGMTAFDPARPRWEFTLIEGLADGRAALVMKVHHALTDGIGGIQLAAHIVDLDRRGLRRPPVPVPEPGVSGTVAERVSDAVTYDLGRAGSMAWSLVSSIPAAMAEWARRPFSIWGDIGRSLESVRRFVQPITNTLSPVMTERRLGWRYHMLEVPLVELKAAAEKADGTLNDGFLAGIAGGLARYHEEHGSTIEEVRVTMPISTRTADDEAGGNHITLVRFAVPLGDHDPISRMLAIDHSTTMWRQEPAIGWSEAIAGALNLLPTAVAAGMLKHVDVLASNVPGFGTKVFIGGARMDEFYAFGPTLGAASNITLMSYCGRCFIGITTDVGAVEDAVHFVSCIESGFAELLAVAG